MSVKSEKGPPRGTHISFSKRESFHVFLSMYVFKLWDGNWERIQWSGREKVVVAKQARRNCEREERPCTVDI